jgi:hypothetical protein
VAALATPVSGLVALGFRGRDGLFDLGLKIANVEAGSGLHRRILNEAGDILGNDLARNLEPPHLVLEGIPIADRTALETPLVRARPSRPQGQAWGVLAFDIFSLSVFSDRLEVRGVRVEIRSRI